jgi:hypothetical protein
MRITRILVPLLGGLLASAGVHAAGPYTMQLGPQGGYLLSYHSNKAPGPMPEVSRVVIVVHGILRDPENSLADAEAALARSGASRETVLLVAPQFWNEADVKAGKVAASAPWWQKAGWSLGHDSGEGRGLSSFTVIDDLVRRFADPAVYPGVKQIVVAGHSAGAQMISRYAAFSTVHEELRKGLSVEHVLANAGTYMYFSAERPSGATFAPLRDGAACPGFDSYKYGLARFQANFSYPHASPPLAYFKRLAARKATYLQGTQDTVPAGAPGGPDAGCEAVLSGATRLDRGIANARYLRHLARREGVALNSAFHRVEGVGHDEGRTWASACGSAALFGAGPGSGAACAPLD